MKNFLIIYLVLFPIYSMSNPIEIEHDSIKLNGFYSTQSEKSKSIAIILHGTRGHQNLEIITSLRDAFLNYGIDSLTINLSYGISNRVNDFLPCDIVHEHKQSSSQKEIELWYNHIREMGYEKIYLIGHSRGGLDIINFYENLNSNSEDSIDSIFLLAPISETWNISIERYKKKFNIDISDLVNQKNKKLKINFLGCEGAIVYRDTFLDYYLIGDDMHFLNSDTTRLAGKGLNLHLANTSGKVYVITATEDTIVPNIYKTIKTTVEKEKNIKLYEVDGADHFFRDFYFDDLMEIIYERIN